MALVVPPLAACASPDDGGVAIGPVGESVRVVIGTSGVDGIFRASPAAGGISGGKGSVIGGAGCEGSPTGGTDGVSGPIGCSCCVCEVEGIPFCMQKAGSVAIMPNNAAAPNNRVLRMISLL